MSRKSLSIFVIWAREYPPAAQAGREKIANQLRSVLENYSAVHVIARNQLQLRGKLFGLIEVLAKYVVRRILLRPAALQALMYEDRRQIGEIKRHIDALDPDVILFDSERLIGIMQAVRRHKPPIRIIADVDDLLSRRYDEFARLEVPINFGFLQRSLPPFLKEFQVPAGLVKLIYKGEAVGLRDVERRLALLADAAVFVSPFEASIFNEQSSALRAVGILPPLADLPRSLPDIEPPFHFMFIGSDALEQNAMTISYLIELWRRRNVRHALKVFGRQTRVWRTTDRVTFEGFASRLEDVYEKGAILLAPSFVAGGIKTKVIEAFGYGAPVIGNDVAFEGLKFDYPLHFGNLDMLEDFVVDVQSKASILRSAREAGLAFARANCTASKFGAQWRGVIEVGSA